MIDIPQMVHAGPFPRVTIDHQLFFSGQGEHGFGKIQAGNLAEPGFHLGEGQGQVAGAAAEVQ